MSFSSHLFLNIVIHKIEHVFVLTLHVPNMVGLPFALLRAERTLELWILATFPKGMSLKWVLAKVCSTTVGTRKDAIASPVAPLLLPWKTLIHKLTKHSCMTVTQAMPCTLAPREYKDKNSWNIKLLLF